MNDWISSAKHMRNTCAIDAQRLQRTNPIKSKECIGVVKGIEYCLLEYTLGLESDGETKTSIQDTVIRVVLDERRRQDKKWGEQNHLPQFWTGILGEEYGELCEAINETVFDNGSDKGGYENMRREAIHVAAVAVGFLECLERNKSFWEVLDHGIRR